MPGAIARGVSYAGAGLAFAVLALTALLYSGPRGPTKQNQPEVLQPERLGHQIVHSRRHALGAIAPRRGADDGSFLAVKHGANSRRSLEPVHHGHLPSHQDQVILLAPE